MKNSSAILPHYGMFIAVYCLTSLGIIMTYSTSAVVADFNYDNPQHFLLRQLIYAIFGTFLFWVVSKVSIQNWKKLSRLMVVVAILFLLVVLIPGVGRTAGGAQRWINLGIIHFQPAEFAKVAVCLYLSDYLTRKRKTIQSGSLKILLPPLTLIGLICLLTLIQPDLGSTALIVMMVSIMIFLAGLRLTYVAIAFSIMVPVLYVLVIRVPYRLSRLTAYLNPWDDPQGSGFQIIQSFITFASGGLGGVGLGQGIQKLFYLPSGHNDFVFSVIAEELGFFGIVAVMLLYFIIYLSGLRISHQAQDPFRRVLILSLTLMMVLQAIIHMMVTTGLVPTKGLPLPFVSYGGTSLLFNFMALGLIFSAARSDMRSH